MRFRHLKLSNEDCINRCLREIRDGKQYIDPSLSEAMIGLLKEEEKFDSNEKRYNSLFEKEQEIFRILLEGRSLKEIEFILGVNYKTASADKNKILKKLGLNNIGELFLFAKDIGLISQDA